MTIVSEPATRYNQLLGELETALIDEAKERRTLSNAKETLAYEEAMKARDVRTLARAANQKVTEAEVDECVRTSENVIQAEYAVQRDQYAYDIAKAQVEIARHRIAFALAAYKNLPEAKARLRDDQ